MILPLRVLGSDVHKLDLGRDGDGADLVAHVLLQLLDQALAAVTPGIEDAVGVDDVALEFVRHADHGGLGHGRVAHQRALDLGRAQAIAARP